VGADVRAAATVTQDPPPRPASDSDQPRPFSDELEGWLTGEGQKTLGTLIHTFGEKSFAILLVVLLALPATPLPTGGISHLFLVIGALIALEMIAGRKEVWLPKRWHGLELGGGRREQFVTALMKIIRRLERYSRPRLGFLFQLPLFDRLLGVVVLIGAVGAFVAPPFSGLDTLPALGVVMLSLGIILEDALIVVAGVVVTAAGIALEIVLGAAALHGISSFF
jgi:hypothetical protein